MRATGIISCYNEGWPKLTDLLRAKLLCHNSKQVLAALEKLSKNQRVKEILRIKPRFGPQNKNLNILTITFDYKGEMICDLKIKLLSKAESRLYHSSKLVHKIEKACDAKDRYRLFAAYTSASICPTNHDLMSDSSLIGA